MKTRRSVLPALLLLASIGVLAATAAAAAPEPPSKGQTVYLPLYSHVYFGDREREFNLTATAYIRNTDPGRAIVLTSADYYSHLGKRLKSFIEKPVVIAPLSSINFTIKESDTTGGSGATVIVEWRSDQMVNPPMVEAVMIGAASTQGISFVCQGKVISED